MRSSGVLLKQAVIAVWAVMAMGALAEGQVAPNNFDGDANGQSDLVVVRSSAGGLTWYVRTSSGNAPPNGWQSWGSGYYKAWGLTGDIPVSGDYGGDGKADTAVFRPSNSTWYISYSEGGTATVQWGLSGDIPMPGVYGSADSKHDITVYRPSTDQWLVRFSSGGTATVNLPDPTGLNSWKKPVPNLCHNGYGFFVCGGTSGARVYGWNTGPNGGSYSDIDTGFVAGTDCIVPGRFLGGDAFSSWYEPSTGGWYEFGDGYWTLWGTSGDIPVSGDFDGDGYNDAAVWRPSSGTWYVNPSSGQAISGWSLVGGGPGCYRQWGASGDTPLNQHVQ